MRAIRLFFVALLAVVLILIATANRGPLTVSLFPESLAPLTGGQWALTMPGFLALFLAMLFGLIVGLVWEWLREAGIRAEAKSHARQIAQLEREVGDMRRKHAQPQDEVLAILDQSASRPLPASSGAGLPATR